MSVQLWNIKIPSKEFDYDTHYIITILTKTLI